jgi:tetratricopeptide (TPR) repeat protein/predicted Ser/Thr protein kinase
MADVLGQTVSHYRVERELGRGGLGEVYLAEDLRLRRPVALKLLRPDARGGTSAHDRLLAEARAASALSHPAIAVVYEVDEVEKDGAPLAFIAMEYVPGRTLSETVRQGRLPVDRVLDLGVQMAEALEAAHAKGVIHRDVKPANVVLSESGRVKVLDFGLAARTLPGETDLTWTRDPSRSSEAAGLAGTLAYMAPEQALGRGVDPRADVFSLGALLYELAAGRPAFAGANAAQLLDAVLHADPAPLSADGDRRLSDLDVLLRRMLAKDPAGRPPDMRGVREDLQRIRRGESPRAVDDAPTVAVLTFANITRSTEDDWLGTGIAETLTADLRGVPGLAMVPRGRIHETLRRLGAETPSVDDVIALQVGREVGSRWVLVGGFQRAGEAVRVTARLLDVATGALAHTVKADGRLAAIFDLQDRLVRELAAGLRATAPPSPARGGDETQVVEAYEAFSKGVLNYQRESYESLDRATFLFERAVALDPAYARAHLELGSAYASKAEYLGLPGLQERAIASFTRALELQPGLVRARREMGGALVYSGRLDEGVAAIQRALELEPENAGALAAMGRAYFIGRGDFQQAMGWYERAVARSPQAGWYWLQLAHCAALVRTFPRAEAAAQRAAELQEQFLSGQEAVLIVGSHMRLGHLAALQGRHAEAVEQFKHELGFLRRVDHALGGRIGIELKMRLGQALLRLGQEAEAQAAFGHAQRAFEERVRLGADDPHTRYYVAGLHALRGETEEALVSLEKAAQLRRALTIARARIEPEFEGLRGEPRFRALVGE